MTIIAVWIALTAVVTLVLEGGHFTFPLDDPYIHLALAKHIAQGHYGINPGEVTAPSSSLLWPFLLVPFAASPYAVAVPVLLDSCCALAVVWLFARLCDELLTIDDASKKRRWVLLLSVAFALATNQIGLALLGMEHSLQVLCAVWLALLIIHDLRGSPPRAGVLAAALALGPLVRYELLGPTLLAAAYFAWRKRWLPVFAALLLACGPLALFSYELVQHGQHALPTSVLMKAGAAEGRSTLATALSNLRAQLHAGWAVMLALAAFGVAIVRARSRFGPRERPLALILLLALVGHLLVGRSGWFGRYEAYVLALAYVLGLALFAERISQWAVAPPSWPLRALLAATGAALAARYVGIALTTPLGALNVYQQQAQVARFVGDHYRRPVGVNDLGYVAWRSDHYVLDFVGLASLEAFEAQRLYPNDVSAWAPAVLRKHDVHFIAIYDEWFKNMPPSWIPCGKLHLGSKRISIAGEVVAFYALDPEALGALRPALRAWAATLPPSTHFELADACR